jgi:hypothetical protein
MIVETFIATIWLLLIDALSPGVVEQSNATGVASAKVPAPRSARPRCSVSASTVNESSASSPVAV